MLRLSGLHYLPLLFGLLVSPQTSPSSPPPVTAEMVKEVVVDVAPQTPRPWSMRRWGLHDGLPQAQVYALCEDGDGALWIGTYGGLAHFDGRNLGPVDANRFPKLTTARVSSLVYDRARDRVYIGTTDNGLFAIEDGESIELNRRRRTWGGSITNLALEEDGTLWISGPTGTYRLDAEGDIVEEVFGRTGDVEDLEIASDGSLWIGAELGVFQWVNEELKQYSTAVSKEILLLGNGKVLTGDHHHRLMEIDPAAGTYRAWQFDSELGGIQALLQTPDGTIWVGGQNPILWDGDTFEFALSERDAKSLRNLPCHALYLDRESSLWFGAAGLHQLRPSATSAYVFEEFETDTPRAVLVDPRNEDVTWIAHVSGKVTRIHQNRVTHTVSEVGTALAQGNDGFVYAIQGGVGIHRLDIDQFDEALGFPLAVEGNLIGPIDPLAFVADPDGGWWFGSNAKLRYVSEDGETRTFLPNKHLGVGGEIVQLSWSPRGELWVGSKDGVCVLRDSRVVQRFYNGEELALGEVRAIHFRDEGYVWLGHYGGGITVVQPDGEFKHLSTSQGLHENAVSEIRDDGQGNLLLLGNRGISVLQGEAVRAIERDQQERVFARVFDRTPNLPEFEGMGGSMPASSARSDGSVLFPALQAVVTFRPEALAVMLPAPQVKIDSLALGDQSEVPEGQTPAASRSVIASFGATTFVDSNLVRYRHRLAGHDGGWSAPSASTVAHYSYVAPGTYELQVQARNRDGVWSAVVASEPIVFAPYWHENPLYRALGTLAVFTTFIGFLWYRARSQRRVRINLQAEVRARTAQLERHRERLQRDVSLRTQDLQQALNKLQADMDAREKLAAELRRSERLQALGRFSGGVAHDFNNILTAILGDAELGHTKAEDEHTRRRFSRIRSAGERASQLIRQMLAFGGQSSGQFEMLDLEPTVRKCVELIEAAIPSSIKVRLDLAEHHARVRMDASQLEQILMNLVFNARDAIQGSGTITIRTRRFDQEHASIEVIDDGQGIPADDLHHIFDPFFTTKEPGKGTGLGLASVHGIVEQAGGEILIDSQVGVGTRLSVLLPAQRSTPAALPSPLPPRGTREEEPLTVLICDDEPEVLRVMTRALEEEQMEVLVAQNPQDALKIACRFPRAIHLLVTDLVMPTMNGVELASKMRQTHPQIQLAYLSGFSQRGISAAKEIDPNVPFLAKPFLPTEFRDFVMKLLKPPLSEPVGQGSR